MRGYMTADSKAGPPAPYVEDDYETIEQAVMETARGRWFLNEYATRNRTADTQMLLKAIRKLERAVAERPEPAAVVGEASGDGGTLEKLRTEIMTMATRVAQTRHEIADLRAGDGTDRGIPAAAGELDAIVETTEKATSDILGAAEQVQEIAWTLREEGVRDDACESLDAYATDIYSACSFQDLTGQRTRKVISLLEEMEARLNQLVDSWALPDIAVREAPAGETPESNANDRPDDNLFAPPTQEDINMIFDGDVMGDDGDVAFRDPAPKKSGTFGKRARTPGQPEEQSDGKDEATADAAPEPAPAPENDDALAAGMALRPGSDTADDLAGAPAPAAEPQDDATTAAPAGKTPKGAIMSLSPAHRVALFS